MITKSPHMQLALEQAKEAEKRDEVPIGTVIAHKETGEVISSAGNRSKELGNPTSHAELLAINEACQKTGESYLKDYNMYVTLEPCPMCAAAISAVRLNALYYGAEDKKSGGVENGPKIFRSSSCHHKPEIYSGILESESALLLRSFFEKKR